MRNKGIAIELTALLDVILIMLFWVMLSLEKENEQVKADAAEQMKQQSEAFDKQYGELETELDTVQRAFDRYVDATSDSTAAANQKALEEFAQGHVITLNLSYDSVGTLIVTDENSELGHTMIDSREDIAERVVKCLENAGFAADDVILCALVYDGDRALYKDVSTVKLAAYDVGKVYNKFYCTYINLSR